MDSGTMVLLSGLSTHGVLLVLAVRELIVLRRYKDRPDDDRGRNPDPVVPPLLDRPSNRPLPPCLRPELMDLRPGAMDPSRKPLLEPA